MYIQPNSDITLYAGIPCTTSYDFAPWFANIDAQKAYFENIITKGVFHEYSFIRNEPNKIKLGRPVTETAYRWQYMSFRNTAYGENRIFYAFITDIDYLNDNCIIITFEIDVLQTYMFDVEFHECFIERNCIPVSQDIAGTNIEPENVDLGPMTTDGPIHEIKCAGLLNTNGREYPYCVVVWSTLDEAGLFPDYWDGGMVAGLYSGLRPHIFYDVNTLNDWLQKAYSYGLDESLVTATIMPVSLIPTDWQSVDKNNPPMVIKKITLEYQTDTYQHYVPNNKKLFTFPYIGLVVSDGAGRSKVYRQELFEDFPNGNPEFLMVSALTPAPQVAVYPLSYAGDIYNVNFSAEARNVNFLSDYPVNLNQGFYMSEFPSITLPIASFIAQLANSATKLTMAAVGVAAGAGAAMLAGAAFAPAAGAALAVGGAISQPKIASNVAPSKTAQTLAETISSSQAKGFFESLADLNSGTMNNSTPSLSTNLRTRDFYFSTQSIRVIKCQRIDNYFSEFGYAINDVQVPDIRTNTRAKQYIKTRNCTISGLCPASALRTIEEIFNHGIKLIRNPQSYTTNATQLLSEQRR